MESRPATINVVERVLMAAASFVSAALLARFAIDFTTEGLTLAIPFWALAAVSWSVLTANIVSALRSGKERVDPADSRRLKILLLSFVPFGFVASSLDCTGLSLHGCSAFCTFVKLIWIPLLAIWTVAYHVTARPAILTGLLAMSFVPLLPHCVCYNVANAWWIDRLGASPECYVWGFVISTSVIGALRAGRRYLVTAAACSAILAGSVSFFVAHHYFRFPW